MSRRSPAILLSTVIACLAALISCKSSELDSKMEELQQTIAISDTYIEAFHNRVSVLKKELDTAREDSLKAEIEYRLFCEYYPFNTDSAKTYVSGMLELGDVGFPKNVLRAWRYSIDGDRRQFRRAY